jgi:hypothetical protein
VVTDATLQVKHETYRTNYNKTARYKRRFTLWDTVYNHSYCFGKISPNEETFAFELHQRFWKAKSCQLLVTEEQAKFIQITV